MKRVKQGSRTMDFLLIQYVVQAHIYRGAGQSITPSKLWFPYQNPSILPQHLHLQAGTLATAGPLRPTKRNKKQ